MNNTKEKIMLTALDLFSVRGYEAVSMRDIGGALGITQAALYRHFDGKRAIFDAIISRMETDDRVGASRSALPTDTYANAPESYREITLDNVKAFALSQYIYWTSDDFASKFRKMLIVEQFRDAEMSALCNQYFGTGVLAYLSDLFRALKEAGTVTTPEERAFEFYAPIYMAMNLSDAAENRGEIDTMLRKKINDYK